MPQATSWTPQGSDASTVVPCTKRKPWAVTNWCGSSHLEVTQIGHILILAFKSLVLFPGDLCELQKPAAATVQTPLRRLQLQPEPPAEDSRIFSIYFGTLGESGNMLSIFICVNGWHTPTRGVHVWTALQRQRTAILLSKSSHHYKLCLNRAAPSLLILLTQHYHSYLMAPLQSNWSFRAGWLLNILFTVCI